MALYQIHNSNLIQCAFLIFFAIISLDIAFNYLRKVRDECFFFISYTNLTIPLSYHVKSFPLKLFHLFLCYKPQHKHSSKQFVKQDYKSISCFWLPYQLCANPSISVPAL